MDNQDQLARLVREVVAGVLAERPDVGALADVPTGAVPGGAVPGGAVPDGVPNSAVAADEAPDVTAVSTKDEFHVPDPADREGYLAMKRATVARLGVWRAGTRYNTWSMLHFRADHATAQDAVFTEVDPQLVADLGLVAGQTMCASKDEFLTRPDLGRKLDDATRATFAARLRTGAPVTIAVGDGLSSSAMVNVPDLLPAIVQGLAGLDVGPVAFVKHCRVGVMDELGPLLGTDVVCLLIGERPGLATGESMSAYVAYRPSPERPESWRSVVSNIYRGGTPPAEAGAYVASLIKRILDQKVSGVDLRP